MTQTTSDYYRVEGWGGIAFVLLGPASEEVAPEPYVACDVPEGEHEHDEACWIWPDIEQVDSETHVRVVMVGDDAVHTVDKDDLSPLSEDEFCHGCGQIGCGH